MNSTAKSLQLMLKPTKYKEQKYYYNNLRADIDISKNTHNSNRQTIAIPAFSR